MPIHDWTMVPDGIFDAFHHYWISSICDEFNSRILPADYYALAAQVFSTELHDSEYYHRKKNSISIRHANGDHRVSVVEIVCAGNKTSLEAQQTLVGKACELLERRIHLLVVDLIPPGANDRGGIHAAIWQNLTKEPHELHVDKPLTLVAYACNSTTEAYLEAVAVGDELPDMPLFLAANMHVSVPLEATYQAAFASMPLRWRRVLEAGQRG